MNYEKYKNIKKDLKNNKIKGDWGEGIALEYLFSKGHLLIQKKYLSCYGEIDLITKKGNIIHFTEVKTVSRETLDKIEKERHFPEENVHNQKIHRICRSAEYFMYENNLYNVYFQIDLITIRILAENNFTIDYYSNINL